MREIKFRYWHIGAKKMFYQKDIRLEFDGDEIFRVFDTDINGQRSDQIASDKHGVLMQFTGLKDKNGTEIYEGDIVECDQLQGYGKVKGVIHYGVEYRELNAGTIPDARIYLKTEMTDFCILHCNPEIIGNIYENPELLK